MIIWLRRHTPTWLLRYLVWRNYRLRMAGRLPNGWYWADLELCLRKYITCYCCGRLVILSDRGCDCNPPVGIPSWLGDKHDHYGIGEDEKWEKHGSSKKPLNMVKYRGVPFYYEPCFCDRSIGESCKACHPDNPDRSKNDL
ncbi:hypothetical protein LCGC14_0814740 [marine sediment metagenome]|uniref:Uncharacterized protein n=1 Tax=marine sediment metagenome TaxID=412755 RepID=A0A0F9PKJ6_9ZZZZ